MAQKGQTIYYEDLPEQIQAQIDAYDPPFQSFTFYVLKKGDSYEVRAVAENNSPLVEAQNGMDEGWLEVISLREEEGVWP